MLESLEVVYGYTVVVDKKKPSLKRAQKGIKVFRFF